MPQLRNVGKRKNQGFTIVEIITVVIIFALLIIAGIPGYEVIMRNTESLTMASRLESSLRLAQGQAIKLGIPVTVCPINSSFNPTTGTDLTAEYDCLSSNAWDAWKVFSDPDFSGQEDLANGSTVMQFVGDIQPGSITSNISGPITFDAMGFANIDPSVTRSGWTWSDSYNSGEWSWSYSYGSGYSGSYSRAFTIAPSGCTGNNALLVTVTQNGVISTTNTAC